LDVFRGKVQEENSILYYCRHNFLKLNVKKTYQKGDSILIMPQGIQPAESDRQVVDKQREREAGRKV
jgi:hypothetical protein